MNSFQIAGLVAAVLIWIVIIWEVAIPRTYRESFANYVSPVGVKSFYGQLVPARGDVGDELEEDGYRADPRYFHGYSEVQRLGLQKDYCRMVEPVSGYAKDAFFACALAGTEGLSSVSYRTKAVKDGFRRSRDDYMRDVVGDGRAGYCAILKEGGQFQTRCYRAGDSGFATSTVVDTEPPDHIRLLLSFYDGILMWFRMRDDIVDYAQNMTVQVPSGMEIQEKPAAVTRGLTFNGVDQFLRIGTAGARDLALTEVTPMRFARAFSVWVRFDQFTNNARIFDFGNGAGKDNVFLGIVCNSTGASADTTTVPEWPSGQQPVEEEYRRVGEDGIDPVTCSMLRPGRRAAAAAEPVEEAVAPEVASLLYEVWDGGQRVMRIIVPAGIKRGKWTHIVITTLNNDAYRPQIGVYIDGMRRHVEMAGFLPQNSYLSHNYIGKSNWASDGLEVNRDELFRGAMFDFRVYTKGMGEKKIKDTIAWGSELLGLASGAAAGATAP